MRRRCVTRTGLLGVYAAIALVSGTQVSCTQALGMAGVNPGTDNAAPNRTAGSGRSAPSGNYTVKLWGSAVASYPDLASAVRRANALPCSYITYASSARDLGRVVWVNPDFSRDFSAMFGGQAEAAGDGSPGSASGAGTAGPAKGSAGTASAGTAATGNATGSNATVGTAIAGTATAGNATAGTAAAGNVTAAGGNSSGMGGSEGSAAAVPSVYYTTAGGVVYKHIPGGFSYAVGPAPKFMKAGTLYVADGTQFFAIGPDGSRRLAGVYENPYRRLDLRTAADLTAKQIQAFLQANSPGSPLIPFASDYLEAQRTFGVNALYLVAHSVIESAWGLSRIAHDKNNLFGYAAYDQDPYDSATTFPSKRYAILYEAWFVRTHYLDPGGPYYHGPDLDGMNVNYATDPNWAESIAAVMWQMEPNAASAGRTAVSASTNGGAGENKGTTGVVRLEASSLEEPVFSYARGASGVVQGTGVNIRAAPGLDATVISQVNRGAVLTLTGWEPGWYRIRLSGGRTAYIASAYVKPENLGKVTGDDVNFRAGPSLKSPVIGVLSYGDEFVALGFSGDQQWLHIRLMDGREGYVSAQYTHPLT
ncbi:MAG: SH3 domain-containing protein [Alicyclobacillus sp.]|nr:SH3 domain-containing protein [Alicyclobacillus sp.]